MTNSLSQHISAIWLYPIKSLDGVSVQQAQLTPAGGLLHDRQYAFFRTSDGRTVNAKKYPALQQLRANFDLTAATVTLQAQGMETLQANLEQDQALLEEWMSEYLGEAVVLRRQDDGGFPDDDERPGPTFLAQESLEEVARWFPELPVDRLLARFRPNIIMEGSGIPFAEDMLFAEVGSERLFQVGDVRFAGLKPCVRCVVPTRDPLDATPAPDFMQRFIQLREQTLPDWAPRSQYQRTFYVLSVNTRLEGPAGILSVGDAVNLY